MALIFGLKLRRTETRRKLTFGNAFLWERVGDIFFFLRLVIRVNITVTFLGIYSLKHFSVAQMKVLDSYNMFFFSFISMALNIVQK